MKVSKRFSGPVFAICVVLALAIDLPASATGGPHLAELSGGKLAGMWKGQYRYDDKRLPSKAFTATIVGGKGPVFRGRIEEPRYTRLGLSGRLSASLQGTLGKDGKVRFVKRYLGAAGISARCATKAPSVPPARPSKAPGESRQKTSRALSR